MHELMHEVIGAHRHIESKKALELLSIPNLLQVVNHCTHLLVLVFDVVVQYQTDHENKEGMLNSMEIMASLGGFLMFIQLIFYWLGMFEPTSCYVTMLS